MERLTVLVCDDELGMRAGVARALRDFVVVVREAGCEAGFDVSQAETGEQALSMIEGAAPDILLLDHKLPGISGLEVLDRVAAMKLDTLVIMITAYATIETAVRVTKMGSYDYLPKPFTPAELKSVIQKAAEHLLLARHARKLAQEKHQVRFQFLSVLAHELKAPLNAVEGYLNVLADRSIPQDPVTEEDIIRRCITRTNYMRKMINDLLDLTRIESGLKKREIAEVDLREAAQTAIESVLPEADPRGITLELHAAAPIVLACDRGEIDIIFNNLVTNAVKYNRDGGRVDVRLEDTGSEVRIAVSDTGIGMTSDESSRLFSDFYRVKNEKTRNILGSGLGLSTVKKVAALYQGDVDTHSEPGIGTTFTVHLMRPTRKA